MLASDLPKERYVRSTPPRPGTPTANLKNGSPAVDNNENMDVLKLIKRGRVLLIKL